MALRLERSVAAALAVTVFAFACGSSIVGRILLYGRPVRWICLAALLVLAVAYAVTAAGVRSRPPPFAYAAVALAVVGLTSSFWSVDAWLTLRRGATLTALVAVGIACFYGSRGRERAVRRLLLGLTAGIGVVAIAGLVTLIVAEEDAVQPATYEYPARFRGFGQNPNTMALLFALGVPLALFLALEARSARRRIVAGLLAVLLAGSITAAGSRGAMLAGLAGALVLVLFRGGTWRRRSALVAVTLVAFAAAVAISQIPDPEPAPSPATAAAVAPTRRTLFTSSGRRAAWRGAIRQAADRPLLGYGFGTEEDAFVNRYAGFASELPENSYIGAALQLGLAGLGLFLTVVVLTFGRFARRIGRLNAAARPCAAACAGGAAAALVGAVTQSYVFSVGNVATATAWLSMFLLASAIDRAE